MQKTNTSEYLPFYCISPNLIKDPNYPDYPYLSGTGFFCKFPPFEYIFYVTAKHCLLKDDEDDFNKSLKIQYSEGIAEGHSKAVVFSEYLMTKDKLGADYEDVFVCVVDHKNITKDELKILSGRSVELKHQDDIDYVIDVLCKNNQNIRTIGYSQPNGDNTDNHTLLTNQDDYGIPKLLSKRPRGFYGKIKKTSNFENRYGFEESNWKEEYRGFSGSPVIALVTNGIAPVNVIIIGMMLTATRIRGEFVSINVITNLIASYINNKLK